MKRATELDAQHNGHVTLDGTECRELRVLLVEDEAGDAGLVRYSLKMADGQAFHLEWVESLRAALEAADATAFDIVLLDLSLPDSSGLETVRHARRQFGRLPIVILTGHDDDAFALEALAAGAQDYLVKGAFETDALVRAIRYAISRMGLEKRLLESEERMAAALEGARLGLWDWDLRSGRVHYNERSAVILGFADGEVPETIEGWEGLVCESDLEGRRQAIQAHLDGQTPRFEIECRMCHRDGREVWVLDAGHVMERTGSGEPLRMVGILQDISARKDLEAQLQAMATTDSLTGLANRRHFLAEVESEYARVHRYPDHASTLLMFDIDHFKRVNDDYGHEAGDRVLVAFCNCVAGALRATDRVGRLGGEEFAVLLPETEPDQAEATAEKIRQLIEAMVVEAAGTTVRITTSIGCTRLLPTDEGSQDALRRADAALYSAKEGGRNRIENCWDDEQEARIEGLMAVKD